LRKACGIDIVTPHASPDPREQTHWCYPDTEPGILTALNDGATHLWANTIVYKTHALQTSSKIGDHEQDIKVIGQPPCLVELYDDKRYVNDWLSSTGQFSMPKAWTLTKSSSTDAAMQVASLDLEFPIVAKPCRGRGSVGVKLCRTVAELSQHVESLYLDSSAIMLEEYLQGEEATVTVMPPSSSNSDYWAMPVVARFNHEDGIAPYNGNVAVTLNSRAVPSKAFAADSTYAEVARQCEGVARLLKMTAPIRTDVRRRKDGSLAPFVLFDINMKPVSSGVPAWNRCY
jgi:D-alanine-D-alanine ligase-like ATP-grasp enzyme